MTVVGFAFTIVAAAFVATGLILHRLEQRIDDIEQRKADRLPDPTGTQQSQP